jgi:hypothetical protein
MRKPSTQKTNSLKKDITLMGVIANASTGDARRLLKKYNQSDALNHEDLEYKLTKIYQNSDDKKVLEKELAEIHPHKDFILKNLSVTETPIQIDSPEMKEEEESKKLGASELQTNIPYMDGNKSSSCGCSGFDGQSTNAQPTIKNDNTVAVLGVLGIITIFAMIIINKKSV